jgi:stage V sporulation protein SpoVS
MSKNVMLVERDTPEMVEVKVAGDTNMKALAGSISKLVQEGKQPIIVAIGGGALLQAAKAAAQCKSYLSLTGIYPVFDISFTDRTIIDKDTKEEKVVSALKLALIRYRMV